jgi:hypothetical protein
VVTPIDARGAGTANSQGTYAASINDQGTITGQVTDGNSITHGFVRSADGAITEFDAPGAGGGPHHATQPFAINAGGTIIGTDTEGAGSAFIRAPNATFTTFDVPVTGASTVANCINAAGVIAGFYYDLLNEYHGFVMTPGGDTAK